MSNFRLRAEGELLVLQVFVPPERSTYSYGTEGSWRDAKTEDIPVGDVFGSRIKEVVVYRDPEEGMFPR